MTADGRPQRAWEASVYTDDGEAKFSARRRLEDASPFDPESTCLRGSLPDKVEKASKYDRQGRLRIR